MDVKAARRSSYRTAIAVLSPLLIALVILLPAGVSFAEQLLPALSGTSIVESPVTSNSSRSVKKIEKEISTLSAQIQLADENLESLDRRLEISRNNLLSIYNKTEDADRRYRIAQESMKKRVRAIYQVNDITLVDVLFSSKSFGQFLERVDYLKKLNRYNSNGIRELNERRRVLIQLQEEAQARKQTEQLYVIVQEQEIAQLKLLLDQQQKLLSSLKEDEQKRIQARLTRKRNSVYSQLALPLSSSATTVSATVQPYSDRTYSTSSNMPTTYKGTGNITSGISSWYGDYFHGMRTANGETYNQNDFTAASRVLPFNTFLAVTYRGKRVIVRINDRGPFIPGRVLDLSKASAKALGLGLGEVEMEIVTPAGTPSARSVNPQDPA